MKKILSVLLFFLVFLIPDVYALDAKEKQSIVELLSKLKTTYAQVSDYSAVMQLESFENEYQLQNQKMWFKKPGYLLLEQLGPFKKGARLAILPDGTIKGHLGGFLSFVVVSIDKDDENMYGVTHDSALNSDYDKIIDIAMSMVDRVTHYSIAEIIVNKKSQLVLDTSYNEKFDRFRLVIDPATMLIIGLERYSKGKLIHKITWNNIETNISISESKFDL